MRIKEIKTGYIIVEKKNYEKYKANSFVVRLIDDLEEAKYNANSLSRCDGISYAVYDCKQKKLVY